ncbi:unnamed protein product [Dibothriocephalus latus]|uniref:Uncharacterized protein n=1 Tax=Dibothriocephalus latus TaxID=60516 RepID=A0A3P7L6Y3_DIBLA|nr:unnamed protein product [Dibothriocephalus latus]
MRPHVSYHATWRLGDIDGLHAHAVGSLSFIDLLPNAVITPKHVPLRTKFAFTDYQPTQPLSKVVRVKEVRKNLLTGPGAAFEGDVGRLLGAEAVQLGDAPEPALSSL